MGADQREAVAFNVALRSITRRLTSPVPVHGLYVAHLRSIGLYTRPTSYRDGQMWDDISAAPMSTDHACARFLVPALAKIGWALFVDGDILARANLGRLFELADDRFAVMCVKHRFEPIESVKMDDRVQTQYPRKNWSSIMLFNINHPSNSALTLDLVNSVPGRDLHRFCWLRDDEIGELPPEWNWLAGHSDLSIDPKIVHFTDGLPSMPGYENCEYAQEWRAELARLAA